MKTDEPPIQTDTPTAGSSVPTVLAALALLVTAAMLACHPVWNNDIWWHLTAGRWMAVHGHVPDRDVFSYVASGQPWTNMTWMFDASAYGIRNVFGCGGLVVVKMALVVAAVGLLLAIRTPGRSALPMVLALGLALPVLRARFLVRPEMLTLVLVAFWLWVLHQVRTRRARPQAILYLVPFQVLWVNVHGLFVLGPVMVAVFLVGETLQLVPRLVAAPQRRRRHDVPPADTRVGLDRDGFRWTAWGLGALVVACMANPYGWRGMVFPLVLWTRISGDVPVFQTIIGELTPWPAPIGANPPWSRWRC